jgi:hypothetical protein
VVTTRPAWVAVASRATCRKAGSYVTVPNSAKPIRKLIATGMAKARSRNSRRGRIGSAAYKAVTSHAAAPAIVTTSNAGLPDFPSRRTPTTAVASPSAPA